MVEVRIRAISEDKSAFLCRAPWNELEALVREVGHWGVYDGSSTENETVGQFVVEGNHAYFEIIFGDDE